MDLEFLSNLASDSYILMDCDTPLEGAKFSCLLCGITTQLIGFDRKILADEIHELKNLISEITSLDYDIILPYDEDNSTFCCPSCLPKLQVLKDAYDSTAKFQHQLKCLSTAIAHQLLKMQLTRQDGTNSVHYSPDIETEWNAQFHEWNEKRLEYENIGHQLDSDSLLDTGQQMLAEIWPMNTEEEEFRQTYTDVLDLNHFERSANGVEEEQVLPTGNIEEYTLDATHNTTHDDSGTIETNVVGNTFDHVPCDMEAQQSHPEFSCEQCPRLFITKEGLNEHMRRKHEAAKRYPCSKCEKVYVQERSLIYHTNTVHGNQNRDKGRNRTCPICGKAMSNHWYLLNHMYKHRKEFPSGQLPCKTCRKEFGSVELLLAHVPTHRGKHRCTKSACFKTFTNSFDLAQHLDLHEKVSKIFNCDYCFKTFTAQSELEVHVVIKHETLFNRNEHTCDTCKESFPIQSLLKAHLKNHPAKDYKCEFCDTSYRTRYELKTHQSTEHNNEKPYRCNECDATFRLQSHLDLHRKRHARLPFVCEHCVNESGVRVPKRFARVHEYWNHLAEKHPAIHAQALGKHCEVCSETFSGREECAIHKLKHSTETHIGSTGIDVAYI